MSSDKMRAEFEAWAEAEGYSLRKYTRSEIERLAKSDGLNTSEWLDWETGYADPETASAERGYEAGYAAGQKAEREAMVKPFEDFAKALTGNKSIAELIEKGNGE